MLEKAENHLTVHWFMIVRWLTWRWHAVWTFECNSLMVRLVCFRMADLPSMDLKITFGSLNILQKYVIKSIEKTSIFYKGKTIEGMKVLILKMICSSYLTCQSRSTHWAPIHWMLSTCIGLNYHGVWCCMAWLVRPTLPDYTKLMNVRTYDFNFCWCIVWINFHLIGYFCFSYWYDLLPKG